MSQHRSDIKIQTLACNSPGDSYNKVLLCVCLLTSSEGVHTDDPRGQ